MSAQARISHRTLGLDSGFVGVLQKSSTPTEAKAY